MGKVLSNMTLAELWEFFPIFLVKHDDAWRQQYEEIESRLVELLADCAADPEHLDPADTTVAILPEIVDELLRDGDAEQPLGGREHLLGRRHVGEVALLLMLGNQGPDLCVHYLLSF